MPKVLLCSALVAMVLCMPLVAAADEYCAMAVGQRPNGSLTYASSTRQSDEATARSEALRQLAQQGIPWQSTTSLGALNGVVVVLFYYNRYGQQQSRLFADSTVPAAVSNAMGFFSFGDPTTLPDPGKPMVARWVRCFTAPQVTWAELQSLGTEADIRDFYGSIDIPPQAAAPVAPAPSLAPASTGLAGMWRRDDDGSIIELVGRSDGKYGGCRRELSTTQVNSGMQVGPYTSGPDSISTSMSTSDTQLTWRRRVQ
jgi:hypothetical protein